MTDLILFLLAWCVIAIGLSACWVAWRKELEIRRLDQRLRHVGQESRSDKVLAQLWHGQFKAAVAELDRRDAVDAAAKAKRSAAGKHARAVQLQKLRDAA